MNKNQSFLKAIILSFLMAMPATHAMQIANMPEQTGQTTLEKTEIIDKQPTWKVAAKNTAIVIGVTGLAAVILAVATSPLWGGYLCGKKAVCGYVIKKLQNQSLDVLCGISIASAGTVLSLAGFEKFSIAIPFGLAYTYGATKA